MTFNNSIKLENTKEKKHIDYLNNIEYIIIKIQNDELKTNARVNTHVFLEDCTLNLLTKRGFFVGSRSIEMNKFDFYITENNTRKRSKRSIKKLEGSELILPSKIEYSDTNEQFWKSPGDFGL